MYGYQVILSQHPYLPVISLAFISVIVCWPFSKENQVFLRTTGTVHSADANDAERNKYIIQNRIWALPTVRHYRILFNLNERITSD